MTNKVKQAIEVLQALPADAQERAAEAIIDYGESHAGGWHLTDEQVAEVERRFADPNPKYLSLTEVRKRLRHFGV